MRVRRPLISVVLLVGFAIIAGGSPASAQVVGGALLVNGSFEGQYASLSGFPDAQVAPAWLPWWVGHRSEEASWSNRRPNFGPTSDRLHSGNRAQRYFTELGTHQAGVLQRVSGVSRGDELQFQVWVRTWSSNLDHTCCSLESGLVSLRAGIDPSGGTNPYASSVVWSSPVTSDDRWTELRVRALAQSNTITVFVFSAPKYPVRHNEVYVDDARLIVVGTQEIAAEFIAEPEELEAPLSVSEPFETGDIIVSGPLMYSIQSGDTLGSIAKQFEIDVDALAEANGLEPDDTIYVAGTLIVPGMTFVAPDMVARYTLREGDTLGQVALAFNTTIHVLAQMNGIVNYAAVRQGTEILVPANTLTARTGLSANRPVSHVVASGETLTRIALDYGVAAQTLASANQLDSSAELHPGQVILIP